MSAKISISIIMSSVWVKNHFLIWHHFPVNSVNPWTPAFSNVNLTETMSNLLVGSKLSLIQKENLCEIIRNYPVILIKSCKRYKERDAVTYVLEKIANFLEFIHDGTYYSVFWKLNFELDGTTHYIFVLDGNTHYRLYEKYFYNIFWPQLQNSFFSEHLREIKEGWNEFDSPYCFFNVSDVEMSFSFLFFNKKRKKNWAEVNDLTNINLKAISKKELIA